MADVYPADVEVVVLAGGKGTRLRPLTAVFPKPLVPIGDKPVLEILFTHLAASGFRKITLCTGYLSELLMAVFGDGSKFDLRIKYSHEETPLGTAGPLTLIEHLTDTFIVVNGDLLTTLSPARMLEYHLAQQADATLAVYRRDVQIDFGVIESNGKGEFETYREKPTFRFDVSMGINVLNRSVLQFLIRGTKADMPELIVKIDAAGGKVCCYKEDCYWLDIGRMDDYALAQEQFAQNEHEFLGGRS